jgi:hypothetical protein
MKGTYQLLVYCNVSLLSQNINIMKKDTRGLSDASKEVALKNFQRKNMFMSRQQTCFLLERVSKCSRLFTFKVSLPAQRYRLLETCSVLRSQKFRT